MLFIAFLYVVGFFMAAGILMLILQVVLTLLSPFFIFLWALLSIATYPIVYFLRLKGWDIPSIYTLGRKLVGVEDEQPNYSYKRSERGTFDSNSYQDRANSRKSSSDEQRFSRPSPSSPPKPDPYDLLGVSKKATKSEIVSAYRRKMMENHPDKVASLDPELQRFATQRTILIKNAYHELTQN